MPKLEVDHIGLEVENLRARVSLQAEVLDLLKLNVGVDVELGRVALEIDGVSAEATLKVRLDEVAGIIDRVLTTIDRNPQILETVARAAQDAVQEVGSGVGEATSQVGRAAGDAVGEVAGQAGDAVGQLSGQVGEAAGELTDRAGEAVGDATQVGGQAVGAVTGAAESVTGGSADEEGGSAGDTSGASDSSRHLRLLRRLGRGRGRGRGGRGWRASPPCVDGTCASRPPGDVVSEDRAPDVEFRARLRARRLRFEEVPERPHRRLGVGERPGQSPGPGRTARHLRGRADRPRDPVLARAARRGATRE